MNILILQGPNLNLLGLKANQAKQQLTLDKLNKSIRTHVKGKDITLKFLQTHKQFQAINFIQRNRNWANGLLIIPTSWAAFDITLVDTINITQLKTASVYFSEPINIGPSEKSSILLGENITHFTGEPIAVCQQALDYLI